MTWDDLAGPDPVGGAVDDLPVDEQMAVHDDLAGLGDRAGESGAQRQGVQAHLQEFDEVLARQALRSAGLLPHALHLGLADAVLGAKALLLLQADGVVRVLDAPAAVLARAVERRCMYFSAFGLRAMPSARDWRTSLRERLPDICFSCRCLMRGPRAAGPPSG